MESTQYARTPRYALTRQVELSYEEAVQRITEALKTQGFGILTEIDVKATLKKKLDKDFTKYVILGACNPVLAYQALSDDPAIGLLLPCNVTVYEDPASGKVLVSILDPGTMVEVTGRKELEPVAQEARARLQAALDTLA